MWFCASECVRKATKRAMNFMGLEKTKERKQFDENSARYQSLFKSFLVFQQKTDADEKITREI